MTLANKWMKEAMFNNNFETNLPQADSTEFEGTVSIHTFEDGSEILSGHGCHWTREEFEEL